MDKISQLVLDRGENEAEPNARSKRSQHIMQKLASVGGFIFISGGIVFVGILLYTIISNFIIAKGEILPGIALLLLLVGAVLLLTYVIYAESQKDSAKREKEQLKPLARIETKEDLLLESTSEMISSVTDRTTESLAASELKNDKATRS